VKDLRGVREAAAASILVPFDDRHNKTYAYIF